MNREAGNPSLYLSVSAAMVTFKLSPVELAEADFKQTYTGSKSRMEKEYKKGKCMASELAYSRKIKELNEEK